MSVLATADLPDGLFDSLHIDDDDADLILALKQLSSKDPKLVKSSIHSAPANPSIAIQSWKMNEFKYYNIPSPFPTLARGLFTQQVKTRSGQLSDRIVARGYDKFFNIGEVPWTTWDSLETHTAPPYTLTLKSNGCIIFIAALTPTQLLITSKHSLGRSPGRSKSHAEVGEYWLREHLAAAGKTEEQLAQTLWDKNWTAVAELCDDSFEEHVLPYGPGDTGLHLHGLNTSSRRFETQAQAVVDDFAREWGFIATASTVLPSIVAVKAFTSQVARTGRWNGEAIEGFVVRTRVAAPMTGKADTRGSALPYPVGSSFFFKIKFDEPYMMYRDWREATKMLLSERGRALPKSKMVRAETRAYVQWVTAEIERDREQFAEYGKGKGIIATRERFLKWLETEKGKDTLWKEEEDRPNRANLKDGKTIIMPVGIPGAGKTMIAVALRTLFGFEHVQSDDFQGKRAAGMFLEGVANALTSCNVVIADKNNHLKQHRKGLRDVAKRFSPPAKLLALHWPFDLPLPTIHRICGDRIVGRGRRHQTLVADEAKTHEVVLWRFLQSAEELTEDEADVSVAMDVEEGFEEAVARAVGAVVEHLELACPEEERVGRALGAARAYEAEQRSQSEGKQKRRAGGDDRNEEGGLKSRSVQPRYFGIVAEVDLERVVGAAVRSAPEGGRALWEELVKGKRVQQRPHVTLVHSKSLPGEQELWERCVALDGGTMLRFRLGHVVGNERLVAATVVDVGEDDDGDVQEFVEKLGEARERLHITVGTRPDVPAVEAKDVVSGWKRNISEEGVWSVPLESMWVRGRVKGLMS